MVDARSLASSPRAAIPTQLTLKKRVPRWVLGPTLQRARCVSVELTGRAPPLEYSLPLPQVGICFVTATPTGKPCLRGAILPRLEPAPRTCATRVTRWNQDELPAMPGQLVCQLASELEPVLIENGSVECRLIDLAIDVPSTSTCPTRHVSDLQSFKAHDSVVLADPCREFVNTIQPLIRDARVNPLNVGPRLVPVLSELATRLGRRSAFLSLLTSLAATEVVVASSLLEARGARAASCEIAKGAIKILQGLLEGL